MARIVVFAKADNDSPDPLLDATKFKRGMVVDVLEDGQEAGKDVEQSPVWRIVEAPGPAEDYRHLVGGDPGFADGRTFKTANPLPRKRVNRVDLDAIETAAGLKAGEKPAQTITLGKATLDLQTAQLQKRENPTVLGVNEPVEVIG